MDVGSAPRRWLFAHRSLAWQGLTLALPESTPASQRQRSPGGDTASRGLFDATAFPEASIGWDRHLRVPWQRATQNFQDLVVTPGLLPPRRPGPAHRVPPVARGPSSDHVEVDVGLVVGVELGKVRDHHEVGPRPYHDLHRGGDATPRVNPSVAEGRGDLLGGVLERDPLAAADSVPWRGPQGGRLQTACGAKPERQCRPGPSHRGGRQYHNFLWALGWRCLVRCRLLIESSVNIGPRKEPL